MDALASVELAVVCFGTYLLCRRTTGDLCNLTSSMRAAADAARLHDPILGDMRLDTMCICIDALTAVCRIAMAHMTRVVYALCVHAIVLIVACQWFDLSDWKLQSEPMHIGSAILIVLAWYGMMTCFLLVTYTYSKFEQSVSRHTPQYAIGSYVLGRRDITEHMLFRAFSDYMNESDPVPPLETASLSSAEQYIVDCSKRITTNLYCCIAIVQCSVAYIAVTSTYSIFTHCFMIQLVY
jgi:hypothetical protein